MTTLSKEDVADLAEKAGCDVSAMDGREYETMWCDANQLQNLIEAARADLVAENEQLRVIIDEEAKDSAYVIIERDKLLTENERLKAELSKHEAVPQYKEARRAEVAVLHDQLTATRTALAAVEAREKLQIAALLTCQKKQIINECAPSVNYKTFDSDLVAKALAQPRDDSALREMIAGVYEECAKVADLFEQKADALNSSIADDDDANEGRSEYIMGKATASIRIAKAIRALAEKAKGE